MSHSGTHSGIDVRPSRLKVLLAFAAIYLIWGSTYLAIRYAIETLPPLLFAGTRFLVAGAALYAWARWRGAARPSPRAWRTAIVIGGLLMLGGNGAVVLAERSVPSGLTALLIATEPLMVVLIDWLRPDGRRPVGRTALGLALGLVGMIILIGPADLAGQSEVSVWPAGLLVFGTISWAAGSIYAARTPIVASPVLFAGMQMLMGGSLLFAAGLARGELLHFTFANVSTRSAAALLYLIVFGAIVAFTSYSWLLRVTTPSMASTYAYVNPVVAVLLGWALAGEPLTARTLLAAAVIVAAVVLITARGLAQSERNKAPGDQSSARFSDAAIVEAGD